MNEARGHDGKEQRAGGPVPGSGPAGSRSGAEVGTEVGTQASLQSGTSAGAADPRNTSTETIRARLAGHFYSDPEVLAEVARRIIERGHL
jgi:hypothetical protein